MKTNVTLQQQQKELAIALMKQLDIYQPYIDVFEKGYPILSNIMLNNLLIEDWGEEYTEIRNHLEKTINKLDLNKIESEFCENKDFIKNYLSEVLKQ